MAENKMSLEQKCQFLIGNVKQMDTFDRDALKSVNSS